jgi:uncharacterized protein YbcI
VVARAAERSRASREGRQSHRARLSRDGASLKEQFTRPKRATTHWAGPDTLVVVLEDTLSLAERDMLDHADHERVRDKRTAAQYSRVREYCEPVERITGRKVRSFLSATDTKVDGLSMETFLLHPAGYDGSSRIDAEA